jgi:hypothetical protein
MHYALLTGAHNPGVGYLLVYAKRKDRDDAVRNHRLNPLHSHHRYVKRWRKRRSRIIILS